MFLEFKKKSDLKNLIVHFQKNVCRIYNFKRIYILY